MKRVGIELREGDSTSTLKSWFAQAEGSVLFIDNADGMSRDEEDGPSPRRDVVQMLLTETENNKDSVLVILAGDEEKMTRFMNSDPGLPGRFMRHVHCDPFSPSEIKDIIRLKVTDRKYELPSDMEEALVKFIKERYLDAQVDTANGHLAAQLADAAMLKRHNTLMEEKFKATGRSGTPTEESRPVLEELDFGIGGALGAGEIARKEVEDEIMGLIGMDVGKEWFRKFKAKVDYVEKTQDRSVLQTCLNLVITGNPGTGKTTFTRLIFKVLHAYGILPRDNFVEKNGLDLKGQYVGSTAPKVKKIIKEAMGGCLFLDEAYALSEGGNDGGDVYAQEAIRTLLTEIENNRTNLMVVFAGYKDKIGQLMRLDPGLDRRFPERLHLTNYSAAELAKIAKVVAEKKFNKTFEDGLEAKLAAKIDNFYAREIAEQNGGLSVNLVEAAVDRQVQRMVNSAGFSNWDAVTANQNAGILTADDFDATDKRSLGEGSEEKEVVGREISELIGMSKVKAYLADLAKVVKYVEKGGNPAILKTNLNMILTGNPGTGKTTTARLIARFLCAHGVLTRSNFVEKNGLDLKGRYVGATAPAVKEAVANAMGGCLFIDEAYALAQSKDSFSGEAVRTLLTEVENNRTDLLVVLAGYKDKMQTLLEMDPGLPRRFATTIHIEDYTPKEITDICKYVAKKRFGFSFERGLEEELQEHIATRCKHRIPRENGGLAVTLTEKAVRNMAMRSAKLSRGKKPVNLTVLEATDYGIGQDPDENEVDYAPSSGGGGGGGSGTSGNVGGKSYDFGGSSGNTSGSKNTTFGGKSYDNYFNDGFAAPAEEEMQYQEAPPALRQQYQTSYEEAEEEEDVRVDVPVESEEDSDLDEEEEVESEEDIDVDAELELNEEVLERLAEIGKCTAGYDWNQESNCGSPCGTCGKPFVQGFRCGGGTHFVCNECILSGM